MTDLQATHQRIVILSHSSRMLDLLESFMDCQHVRYLRIDSLHSVSDVTCAVFLQIGGIRCKSHEIKIIGTACIVCGAGSM